MSHLKTKESLQEGIIRMETEIHILWKELEAATISHKDRMELQQQLQACETDFKSLLAGQYSLEDLQRKCQKCTEYLVLAAVAHAEQEISKGDHLRSQYLALQTVRRDIQEGKMMPWTALHAVKEIMRHPPV